ncbi:MAG: agmatine deiminase family protein [Candidatus Cloacimonetes bacterium]|nr:agmatine deiminase family protein [Candidatus Cloacimonadota bacterium]MCF7814682.1 agmatine deiminase family protein [Candidatus Cloacimonadota bacterium]MCF7868244.1 agmatine deiminase family protein [Candidatus Cloacimonadota bacterium]
MIAEWEPAIGTLIRWPLGIPSELVVELAEDDSLYILVENSTEEQQARAAFASWNVNMEHCSFIFADTYSHWTRDWGPQCLFDGDGQIGILDPIFDGYPWVPATSRDWSEDDAVNAAFADQMNWNNYQLPAYLTGGNVMYDGYNSAFSSQQMLDENLPILSNNEFFDLMQQYAGIETYNIISNFENLGIQHIDCIAKLLDEETVLIKEVDIWHPEYNMVEQVAAEFENFTTCFDRPYNIIRIYCDYYLGNDVAAYTNSLILNKKVLVPLFGIASDDEAIATYEAAMPGYEIIGIPYSEWYYYDALHCRTMGIFDPDMIRIEHKPYIDTIISNQDYPIACKIVDYSQQGLIDSELKLFWKTASQTEWNSILLQETAIDSFSANIPHQPQGTEIQYYISASSNSGKTALHPIAASDDFHNFICQNSVQSGNTLIESEFEMTVFPNPFNPSTTIEFSLTTEIMENTELEIYNLRGQKVKTLSVSPSQSLKASILWNGTDDNNQPVSSGVYFVKLQAGDFSVTKKCLLMK